MRVNDSISYTIVSVGNKTGVCSYFFLASLNNKSKKVVTSMYLYPDCDVDYSSDTYELYEYKIISNAKIRVIETKVFQKKNRTSTDDDENIDHKQIKKSYFAIGRTDK